MTPEQLKASYGRQFALLVRMLPIVARESCFAIKGGTAINLFYRELPRLSVDIDLTYLPIANRRESLDGIADALGRIGERIESQHPYVRVRPEALKGERRLYKLNVEQGTTKIKVEASTVLRGCVYPHERRAMSSTAGELFTRLSMQVVSHADLYAGKIMASLSRQHPRDLYDVHGLLTNEGIDDRLRAAFVVYLISGNKPTGEVLSPRRTDLSDTYHRHLSGMLNEPIPLETLYQTREALVADIVGNMPDRHRQFLLRFEKGEPDWDLLEVPHAKTLPAVLWKMHNFAKVGGEKRNRLVDELEAALEMRDSGVGQSRGGEVARDGSAP